MHTIGDEGFGSIDNPVIAITNGTGFDTGDIRTSMGLGNTDSTDFFACYRSRQIALLLLLSATMDNMC